MSLAPFLALMMAHPRKKSGVPPNPDVNHESKPQVLDEILAERVGVEEYFEKATGINCQKSWSRL